VIEQFERTHVARLKPASARVYRSHLTRTIIPALGEKHIAEIRRRDIIAVVEDVAERLGRPTAIAATKVLHKCLAWAVARDLIDANPASGVPVGELIGRLKPRDRLLTDAELRAVWQAIPRVGPPWSTVYKLLLLTGLRLNEVAAARWRWFDHTAGTLLLPAEVTKNGEAMLVPPPPLALDLLRMTPHFTGPFIFSSNGGHTQLQAASGAKQRLDKALREMGTEVGAFVIHDFRRVVRSGLGRIGIPPVVAELCLGHKQAGIIGVYDRHSYFDEKRDALLRWQTQLLSIVEPPPTGDNVLPLARTA
jgi:integrase